MKIFLKLAIRNFLKDKLLNGLNVLGLSLALLATILIMLYVDHEFSYDSFHSEIDHIYRLEAKTNSDQWFASLGIEHGRELSSGKYPEVISKVQLNGSPNAFLNYKETKFPGSDIYKTSVGSEFFSLFGFKVLEGDPENLLAEPYATVITESLAEKFFGNDSPLGESLEYDTLQLKITGVIEDLPTNSHLSFKLLFADPVSYEREHYHTQTYLRLVNNVSLNGLERKILQMDVAYNEFHKLSEVKLMPVKDIYLKSDAIFGFGGKGDLLQIMVFAIISGLILLIAVTNYVNLSLAIYLGKGREIGIRKVLGESKNQIVRVFVYESFLMTLLTIPLVLIGLIAVLPFFNDYLDISIGSRLFDTPIYGLSILAFILVVSILTITFPAISLDRTESHLLIKSKSVINITGGTSYRNVLVFIQFVLLFTLGISAWFLNRQINYLDDKDVGFNAEGVIKISNAYEIGSYDTYKLFKNKLLSYSQIGGVTFGPMMGDNMRPLSYRPEGFDENYENLLSYGVDIDYFDVMEMKITQGDFKSVLGAASAGQIVSLVNENFIKRYDWQDDPIGKKIVLRPGTQNELHRKVSAVFKDFHFFTLKEKITPQIISLRPDPQFVNTNILIKSGSPNLQYVMKIIEDQWYEVQPNIPIELELMEDAVRKLYVKERQTGQISMVLSLLAVALSVLGLIGFMIYIIGLKSKEIAVRKVLGASLFQIIHVLNQKLFLTILFSAIIGSSLSYFLVKRWLEDYAYSITIEPSVFIITILLVYVIVFTITGAQSVKSAQTNPVMALKDE